MKTQNISCKLIFLFIFAAAFSLSGCGVKGDPKPPTGAVAEKPFPIVKN